MWLQNFVLKASTITWIRKLQVLNEDAAKNETDVMITTKLQNRGVFSMQSEKVILICYKNLLFLAVVTSLAFQVCCLSNERHVLSWHLSQEGQLPGCKILYWIQKFSIFNKGLMQNAWKNIQNFCCSSTWNEKCLIHSESIFDDLFYHYWLPSLYNKIILSN